MDPAEAGGAAGLLSSSASALLGSSFSLLRRGLQWHTERWHCWQGYLEAEVGFQKALPLGLLQHPRTSQPGGAQALFFREGPVQATTCTELHIDPSSAQEDHSPV